MAKLINMDTVHFNKDTYELTVGERKIKLNEEYILNQLSEISLNTKALALLTWDIHNTLFHTPVFNGGLVGLYKLTKDLLGNRGGIIKKENPEVYGFLSAIVEKTENSPMVLPDFEISFGQGFNPWDLWRILFMNTNDVADSLILYATTTTLKKSFHLPYRLCNTWNLATTAQDYVERLLSLIDTVNHTSSVSYKAYEILRSYWSTYYAEDYFSVYRLAEEFLWFTSSPSVTYWLSNHIEKLNHKLVEMDSIASKIKSALSFLG